MDLKKIAEKISKNWKGLPNGLNYTYNPKYDVIYFDYLCGDDIAELNDFAKKYNKRIELYPITNQIKVIFKDAL